VLVNMHCCISQTSGIQ